MKKHILLLIIILTLSGCQKQAIVKDEPIPAPKVTEPEVTELAGIISRDTTVGGVIRVVKDVFVSEGVTLTIEPGSTVIMVKSESTKVEPFYLTSDTEIIVRGSIIANGTADKKIRFIPEKETADLKGYTGIILLKSEGARFEHCTFKMAETAIHAVSTKVEIIDCDFESCFYALSADSSVVNIKGASVTNCDKGFYFHRGSTGSVTESEITGSLEDGIFLSKKSKLDIKGNLFKDNRWGISTIQYSGKFTESNEFINNKIDVKALNY